MTSGKLVGIRACYHFWDCVCAIGTAQPHFWDTPILNFSNALYETFCFDYCKPEAIIREGGGGGLGGGAGGGFSLVV